MNKYIKLAGALSMMGLAFMMTSCDDWSDTESIDLVEDRIETQNPELYEQYLENLRAYKLSDHKYTMVTFDNSEKNPVSRGQHFNSVPDSVDIVTLSHPDNLANWEVKEMHEMQAQKGTKFIVEMDFDNYKNIYEFQVFEQNAAYEKALAENPDTPKPVIKDFNTVLVDSLNTLVKAVAKYDYDGIEFGFIGSRTLQLTPEQLDEYQQYSNICLGLLTDWRQRNPNKMFIFKGKPTQLADKSFLESCDHIVIDFTQAKSLEKMDYEMRYFTLGVEVNDRYIVSVDMVSLDELDIKTGHMSNGELIALDLVPSYVVSHHDGYSIRGLEIHNVSNDYYNGNRIYDRTRTAINYMNY